ncbi:Na+/H+ antiporter NhaC [Clostridium sp. E02]|uniref:Na+/H+ antiporter NhaC n=1 Tax=Clostridium sp. E02 TaxID=2487134 RepID=UPI000F52B9FE|nr:Na+/H+ antiporter NhaC [Clostridium sp. E02]
METKEKDQNTLSGPQSAILMILIVASVAVCIRLKVGGPMIGLFFSWLIIYVFCLVLKIDYKEIKKSAFDALKVVLPTMTILMAIGVLIGTWMLSGTIPTIIVYGLKSINPTYLLPFTLIFTSILSLVTGTSYGSAGSAGVAMMAIGNAMGINPGMVAGAVICGAMFGDKLSPFSDTTNLAPAVAGAKLGDHIRSMLWTTVPPFLICIVIFAILGITQTSGNYNPGDLNSYINYLEGNFNIGLVTLLPAVLIIVLLIFRVGAFEALGIGAIAGGLVAIFAQGETLRTVIGVCYNGFSCDTDIGVLKSILNRGGMSSMLQYVAIITFAVGMGGMLDRLGVLNQILSIFLKRINGDGSLILATIISGYVTSIISCSSPMSHVLTGRLMGPLFKERNIEPSILSRSLEDSGTLAGPMIPWHGYGIYMAGTLGVAWAQYILFVPLLWMTPLFSILYGFTGFTIKHKKD